MALLQAEEGLVFAIDRQGARRPLTGTPGEREQPLDLAQFFRLNRGELLHIGAVGKVEPYFNGRLAVKLRHGAPLISSAAQTPAFRRWLGGWGAGLSRPARRTCQPDLAPRAGLVRWRWAARPNRLAARRRPR